MRKVFKQARRGQALVMITTSLIALCGIMGLAVDLGWGYFVKKAGQRAADAAALAATEQALAAVGQASTFVCGTNLTCQATASSCASTPNSPPVTNLDNGCLYAQQNGFSYLGDNGRQNVTIQANTTNPVPTAPNIHVDYWVTVRVNEQIPQLFSSVLGNGQFSWANSSARATAAVVDSPVPGSIYLIDRQNDKNTAKDNPGTNLDMNGGGSITATGGMYMASTGDCAPGQPCAGSMGGSASVTAGYVGLRGTGEFNNTSNVNPTPSSGLPDQANFKDPMRGKGQPPPPAPADAPAPTSACTGTLCGGPVYDKSSKTPGLIDGTSGCVTVGPGTYYAVDKSGKATGDPITMKGCVNFTNNGTGFGNYVFFGGANLTNPGSVITTAPGRYIFAGANGTQGSVFSMSNGVTLQDQTPLDGTGNMVANTDAGEVFVFTDANYAGGVAADGTYRQLFVPSALNSIKSNLVYGDVSIQMGNTSQSMIDLHGLNGNSSAIPNELITFAPTVFWSDQGNTPVLYDGAGNIVDASSCGGGGTLDTPCANTNPEVTMTGANPSTQFTLQAVPGLHLYGVFYQPRGDTLIMQGSGSVSTPMILIAGSLKMGGGPTILQPLTNNGLLRKMVALVE